MNGGIYNAALFGASQREARNKLDKMAGINRGQPSGILASSSELMQAVGAGAGAPPAVPQRPTTPPQQMPTAHGTAPAMQPALPQMPMPTAVTPQQPAPRPMAPAPQPQPQPVQQPASPTTPMGFAEGQEVKVNRQNPEAVRQSISGGPVDVGAAPTSKTYEPAGAFQDFILRGGDWLAEAIVSTYGSKKAAEDAAAGKLKAVKTAINTGSKENAVNTVLDQADTPTTPEGKKDFAKSVLGLDTNDIGAIDDAIFATLTADVSLSGERLQQAVLLGLQNYKQTAAARAAVKKGSEGKGWLDTEQGKAALTIYTEQIKNNVPPSEAEQMMNQEMGGNIGTLVRMAVTGGAPTTQQPTSAPKAGTVMDGYEFQGGDPADKNNWKKVG